MSAPITVALLGSLVAAAFSLLTAAVLTAAWRQLAPPPQARP